MRLPLWSLGLLALAGCSAEDERRPVPADRIYVGRVLTMDDRRPTGRSPRTDNVALGAVPPPLGEPAGAGRVRGPLLVGVAPAADAVGALYAGYPALRGPELDAQLRRFRAAGWDVMAHCKSAPTSASRWRRP